VTILVTPDNLRTTAAEIERSARRLESLVGDTTQNVERAIASAWIEGHRASSLIARYRRAQPTMEVWPTYLRQFADRLRAAADAFDRADQMTGSGTPQFAPAAQQILLNYLRGANVSDWPIVPLFPGQWASIHDVVATGRFMQALFGNVTEPDVLVNTLQEMHYDGAADVVTLLQQSQGLDALPGLLGKLDVHGMEAVDFLTTIYERGLSVETVSDWGFSELAEKLVTANPVGMKAMLFNAGVQFAGGMAIDGTHLWQHWLTGGDASLVSYQIMDDGISAFSDALQDANLKNVFEGVGRVATDIYVEPLIKQYQETFRDPSVRNIMESIVLTTNPQYVGIWLMDHPEQRQELLTDAAGLLGDTLDVGSGIARLAPASARMGNSLIIGTEAQLIEWLPISDNTRQHLLNFASFQADVSGSFSDFTLRNPSRTDVDWGDTFRNSVSSRI